MAQNIVQFEIKCSACVNDHNKMFEKETPKAYPQIFQNGVVYCLNI